ncbi:hypothetical protein N9Z79_07185 [Akkermansiaceae bacterium]|nr:hypothetical protein [Akkermansiaceae bacterium]
MIRKRLEVFDPHHLFLDDGKTIAFDMAKRVAPRCGQHLSGPQSGSG